MLEHQEDTQATVNKFSRIQKCGVLFDVGKVKDEFACLKLKMHNYLSPKLQVVE